VQLPESVRQFIEERADAVGFAALKRAAAAMSGAYREGGATPLARIPAEERTAAYLVTRMPATYAAAFHALRELSARLPEPPAHILDLGAGTGAASLAARHWFPAAEITMIERDPALAEAARAWLPDARQIAGDATKMDRLPGCDLAIAAYSLGESGAPMAQRLWQAARIAMLAIEPGTPRGFALVRALRDELLAAGAHLAAPCPAEGPCPMTGDDWCHFAARVERSSIHRRVKGGELGYEDEKFSYVGAVRSPVERAAARIVRHPRQQPGLITIALCTPDGLREERVTRREREKFRAARKAAWGGEWPGTPPSSRADDPAR